MLQHYNAKYREEIAELKALPDKWRKKKPIDNSDYYRLACEHCADEVEAVGKEPSDE